MKNKVFPVKQTNKRKSNYSTFNQWFKSLSLSIIPAILTALPVNAAKQISLGHKDLNILIPVSALENYAKTGEISYELASYMLLLEAEKEDKYRDLLHNRYNFPPQIVSQFINSPMGELFLKNLGKVIKTSSNSENENLTTVENGAEEIRTALLKAANDAEGLTIINFIRHFPSDTIWFDTKEIFAVTEKIAAVQEDTKTFIETVANLTQTEAYKEEKVDFSRLPDIRKKGKYNFSKQQIILQDEGRDRNFSVQLYLPNISSAEISIPVVVISHGLGSNGVNFESLAKHLASYGFAVALPQHPGSDYEYIQKFLAGKTKDMFHGNEFIDRPLDISFLLNQLEQLNQYQFHNQLNLKKVGIFGHSFGAYTAFALAGAEINFQQLKQDCGPQMEVLNMSLLLQCRALELKPQKYNLKDDRIGGIFVLDPVNSSLFGKAGLSQIELPVLWGSASEDKITPIVLEQAKSFTWLTTPDKYLVLTEGADHINIDFEAIRENSFTTLAELIQPDPDVVNGYANAFGLAFFQTHVADRPEYSSYLQASYAQTIGEKPFNLSFVRSLSETQLSKTLKQARKN
ncbi:MULTISPECIES: alpha/beta hydrolase [Okeania]|uniref:Alpha/beta fold hydrolase n=2 Tax=Okeania TaxID=1458928 RepID=A0A3N6PAS7_9CYAN|nr:MULTISPECIES: alpha/beta hydrolase [Okeania]NET79955.1 alpha/beta fold hydrolase [Okeania sp. SIO1F9]RQH25826.1 alpha/beta fold hydrolase [Okeania hirsuta]RQH38959.1 alpha/beta fold hydrolase [Okeania hirsuta]